MPSDVAERWHSARPPARHLHLDSAAAGRASTAVVEAVHRHQLDESALGAYVAELLVTEQLDTARATIGELLGAPADTVSFVESASAGRAALLAAWPFGDDATSPSHRVSGGRTSPPSPTVG